MSASLLIDGPGMWAYNIELKKIIDTSIGRTRHNEVVLQDARVSSKHAIISYKEGEWFFKDLGSSNGSMLNGRLATDSQKLKAGDVIRIGSSEILFKNKDQASSEDWGQTVMKLNQHELALREALRKAESAKDDDNIVIPDLHIADQEQRDGDSIGESITPEADQKNTFSAEYESSLTAKEAEVEKKSTKAEDMLWVAEKFAEIVGNLARSGGKSKTAFYTKALEGLRDTLEMQNGFLMVPNKVKKRWVIEAWVGDNEEWTSFEKSHPVPLTVANDSYKSNEIISNVWGEHRKALDSSASLMSLNVQTYLAVPIHKTGKKAGLIYLDQRKQFRPIVDREVYLVSKLGKYIVELEYH